MNTVAPQHRARGLTIVELLIVVALLGVIAAVVAPSMRGMMARQRVQGINAELTTDLQFARSELTRRGANSAAVAVTFGGDSTISCYTIHMVGAGATCDCTRPPGSVCLPTGILQEVKTVQVARAMGVAVSASSPSGSRVSFAAPQGLATPTDLVISVQGDAGGQLRTSISPVGTPTVCSPDGSIRGVPTCP